MPRPRRSPSTCEQRSAYRQSLTAIGFKVSKDDVLLVMILALASLSVSGKGVFLMLGAQLWPRQVPTLGEGVATSEAATLTK